MAEVGNKSPDNIWTIRGVTADTKQRFKDAARSRHVSIGELANQVLSAAAEAFAKGETLIALDDHDADLDRPEESKLNSLEARVAALEAAKITGTRGQDEVLTYGVVADTDLFVQICRAIGQLDETAHLDAGVRTLIVAALRFSRPRALEEVFALIVREIALAAGDESLSIRIGDTLSRLSFGPTDLPTLERQ